MTSSNDAPNNPAAFAPPAPPTSRSGALQPQPVPPRSKKPLVAAIGVVVLVAAGVGVFIATRSDDKKSSGAKPSTLVRYNHDEERLEVLDASGDVVDDFDVPDASESTFASGLPGRVVFDSSQNGEIVVMKVADGSVDRFDVPDELDLDRAFNPNATNIVLESLVGGDVVVIDLESGDVTSARDELGDDDAKYLPGRRFDSGSTYNDVGDGDPQTLVVPISGSALWVVPGFVVALDGERSLAFEPGDDATTVSIYTGDEKVGSVDVDGIAVGGLLTGDKTAVVVTDQGDVVKIDVSSEKVADAGSLDNSVSGAVVLRSDRLLVLGDGTSSFLLDQAGKSLAEFEPIDDGDGEPEAIGLGPGGFRPGAQCFATQPGSAARAEGGDVALRDLDTGDVLTELDSSASVIAGDTCVAVTPIDDSADAYFAGKVHEYDGYAQVFTVSPDLSQVVVSGKAGIALVDVESGDETDLNRYQYAYVTG